MDDMEHFGKGFPEGDKEAVQQLLHAEKYAEILSFVRRGIQAHPHIPFYPAIAGHCYNQLRRPEKAAQLLRKYIEQFPDHAQLYFELGQSYLALGNMKEAEISYRCAVDRLGEIDDLLRSSYLTSLGGVLWGTQKRDEAITVWREALALDENNQVAAQLIQKFENQYGEPKGTTSRIEELSHFENIQTSAYLRERHKESFGSPEELNRIRPLIMCAWTDHIVPRQDEMNKMTAAEKSELYSSVRIDFDAPASSSGIPPRTLRKERNTFEDMPLFPDDNWEDLFEEPKRTHGLSALVFAPPALIAAGFSFERFSSILEGESPTDKEQELLMWAHDLVEAVLDAMDNRGTEYEVEAMMDAVAIAAEELDPALALIAVRSIRLLITEVDRSTKRESSRKKRKKKKH